MATTNPFNNVLEKLRVTLRHLGLDESYFKKLSTPNRVLEHTLDITMDNGKQKQFEAYRVQFNNARGPYKGGIRYHPQTDLNEVKMLAFLMALKCAVANIPMGGGKGGITVNPKELSGGEIERLSRAWVGAFFQDIGPHKDIPAPDVYTNPQIMAWMVDEYSRLVGESTPATFTGKPIKNGGSEGREYSTAQGGYYVLHELLEKLRLKPEQTRVVVQGFGNVGFHTARILHEHGFRIIGLSDSKGGIVANSQDFNPAHVMQVKKEKGVLVGAYCRGSVCDVIDHRRVTNAELLEIETDILIPAALENQITRENASRIKAKAILEMANNPITPEADEILFKKGIQVVPDILANAGGVTVSYFEWEQNLAHEHWTEQQVLNRLEGLMKKAFDNVWAIAQTKKIDLRTAAYILGVGRIVDATTK